MSKTIKEIDLEGLSTLNVIEKADKFNKWMYQTINPYCKGEILEIGSGIGNISKFFVEDEKQIVLSDLRDNYCEILKEKFNNRVLKIDLVHPDFEDEYASLLKNFDTIFALNVVEHIENDIEAIANCKKLLKKGGVLIILVPAYQWLFCNFDKELEHFRRYSKKNLENIIQTNHFKIKQTFYFNGIGIFGWFLSGKILNKKTIPEGQMGLFNLLVPVFKLVDKMTFRKIGLSVICISIK
jgi:2-polyprenyl-3-methyl-5-hydroxy-6-metoxy-1,4-benzoquinol methylase